MMPIKVEQQQMSHDDEWILVEEDQSSEKFVDSSDICRKYRVLNNDPIKKPLLPQPARLECSGSNEYVEKIFRLNSQNNQDATANSNSKASYSNKVAGRPLHTSHIENCSSNNSSQDDEADDYEHINDPKQPPPPPLTLELDHYTLVNLRGQALGNAATTIKEETEEEEDGAENEEFAVALSNSVKWNLEDLLVKKDDQKKERRKKRKWRTCQKEI
uniref:Uncharacterized protein n=1 Tax=Romanomermis culicivorax TaxID=13658 RepID=A0A915L0S7_ROMCU